jgi:signal transduction histidine kinase
MKARSRSILILSILFSYILLQFLWWEVLLVKQNGNIISEKQKLVALSSTDSDQIQKQIDALQRKKHMQTFMIVGEGTVFLLLLLFGIYKIKQAMDKEMYLSQQQKNFFLSVTHELKTPIAATKLQLQTLQKQSLDEATRKTLLGNALNETERLNSLIDNILIASRLESREFKFQVAATDLSALVVATGKRYFSQQLSNATLTVHSPKAVQVNIDEQAFQSVIINLLDNAFKYSTSQPHVSISVEEKATKCFLRVADQGIGIAENEKMKVFDKFYRSGNEDTRRTKGTGLGLFIVYYIVRMHEGQIRILNNKPSGSIFEIELNVA